MARSLVRSWLDQPIPVAPTPNADVSWREKKQLGKQILFISSISGLVAMSPQKQSAYNASKGALTMLSKVSCFRNHPRGPLTGRVWPQNGHHWASLSTPSHQWVLVSPPGDTEADVQGYVSTDMIANPPDEEAKAWASEWQQRTPAGR